MPAIGRARWGPTGPTESRTCVAGGGPPAPGVSVVPGIPDGSAISCGPVICPYCNHNDDKVIDSRASDAGRVVRRRRECLGCSKRFTTYEKVEETARLMVVKRDGTRVPFSRENILKGVLAACGKRPISDESKQNLVSEVEEEAHRDFDREVPSRAIGERVMAKLATIDKVAYVRFASEYYRFENVGQFVEELRELDRRPRDVKDQAKLF